MSSYIEAKQKYDSLYQYDPGDIQITYRLLSWKEYLAYVDLLDAGVVSKAIIEESIFTSCVIDDVYTTNVASMSTGHVVTVVGLIMTQSGPGSIDDIANTFDAKRAEVGNLQNQIVAIICRAFPGYTPDQIGSWDWDVIMERFALAEDILLSEGRLAEPLKIADGPAKPQSNSPFIDFAKENAMRVQHGASDAPPGGQNISRRRPTKGR